MDTHTHIDSTQFKSHNIHCYSFSCPLPPWASCSLHNNLNHNIQAHCYITCGTLADPNELVEDSESLRVVPTIVGLTGATFSMPRGIFTVDGDVGWRA